LKMKILVSGSSGLVGSRLVPFLESQGCKVIRLVRLAPRDNKKAIEWDPAGEQLVAARLESFDAVVHLAGEGVATGRWSAQKKQAIRESRVKGTRFLCENLARLENPPKVLVVASAVGIYGNRGDEVLSEKSSLGEGFLADVGREWEAAAEAARKKGIRVVHLRFGVVLTRAGGALKKMLPPFQIGVGGILGNGKQYMSWLSIDDALSMISFCIKAPSIEGAVNAVSPNPVTNVEFTKALGSALRRPTLFPVPRLVLRLILGEMADELLLASTRVRPSKLEESGYSFRHPKLEAALADLL
jgi:uncharacterized protein